MGPANALAIVDELSEWVMDIDHDLGRRAVRAIGQIGVKAAPHIMPIVQKLLSFCDVSSEICSEVVQCLKVLLRKYPQLAKHIVPETTSKFPLIDDAEGKVRFYVDVHVCVQCACTVGCWSGRWACCTLSCNGRKAGPLPLRAVSSVLEAPT